MDKEKPIKWTKEKDEDVEIIDGKKYITRDSGRTVCMGDEDEQTGREIQ